MISYKNSAMQLMHVIFVWLNVTWGYRVEIVINSAKDLGECL